MDAVGRLAERFGAVHQEAIGQRYYECEFLKYITGPVRQRRILCLDPGETMGWCVFDNGILVNRGQLMMKMLLDRWSLLSRFLQDVAPTQCVMENYIVYGYKAKEHAWSSLFTPKLIGAIEVVCQAYEIPVDFQMAAEAKMFAPDPKLKRWDIFQTGGLKHANDSIRHGLYYMLKESQSKQNRNVEEC